MKLYIETMGCPKNFNDSEGIGGIWESAGMETTSDLQEADAILINTCCFINDAKQESIDRIFDMVRFIEQCKGQGNTRDKKTLIVSGCLSQRYGKELEAEIPEVDIFLGVNDYEKLPGIVREFKNDGRKKTAFSCHPEAFTEFSARKTSDEPYTETLRIAEGCDNRCSYCVIPDIRGRYRSRPMENIVEEAGELALKGCKELMLTAQDVTGYGKDLYGKLMLPELLRKLSSVEGIRWIRLMYCYEDKITDELIDVIASEEKVCDYIDIPLQHISDDVLRRMNRHSTEKSIKNTIDRLRRAIPDIHIRTTFITGFPGERQEDFDMLLDFIEDEKFERLGVFTYSQEEGTAAGAMDDQIEEETKNMRADMIMRKQMDISRELNEKKIGSIMDVMVDGTDEEGSYTGRTVYDAPEIDNGVIFDSDRALKAGDIVSVKITDAFDYDITGRMED